VIAGCAARQTWVLAPGQHPPGHDRGDQGVRGRCARRKPAAPQL